ncbi:hypothetical protein A2U01_0044088 [Trifolium medium]|uniref:Uncharacterized protein n=1 Tax=Trifolium medium TaxID=97028 RepID=A0A392QGP3_9FABA|nr:hypothetical protein [Trifolium medium]
MMQVELATASGLIHASPLPNATAVEPGAAQTYSTVVNWKKGNSNIRLMHPLQHI